MSRGRGRRRPPVGADERGETTTQVIVMVPALMLLILLGVQSAMWFHAANVAQVAAARGAAAGSVRGGGEGAAVAESRLVVLDNSATASVVTAGVSDDTVTVTVTVDVPHLVPFFPSSVTRTQLEPLERFVSEAER
jgi:hypothetical protein